jgi:hypothetical protein
MPVSKLLPLVIVGVGMTLSGQVKVPSRAVRAETDRPKFGDKLGYLSPGELSNAIGLLPPRARGALGPGRSCAAETTALASR